MANDVLGFGFGGAKPYQAPNRALEVADAICDMMDARRRLDEAKERVPDYTGQWQDADYYATEENEYNVACDRLHVILGRP